MDTFPDSFTELIGAHEKPLVRDVFADRILSRTVSAAVHRAAYDYRLCVRPDSLGLGPKAFGGAPTLSSSSGAGRKAPRRSVRASKFLKQA